MDKTKIVTSVEVENVGIVGTMVTNRLELKKGSGGPGKFDAMISNYTGKEVSFTLLEKPPCSFSVWFDENRSIKVSWVAFQNCLGFNPSLNNDSDNDLWKADNCWVFNNPEKLFPRLKISILYKFSNRSGFLSIKQASVVSLNGAVSLPDFRWRKDLHEAVKVKAVSLSEPVGMFYVVHPEAIQEGIPRTEPHIYEAGNYDAFLYEHENENWLVVIPKGGSLNDYKKKENWFYLIGLRLSDAVINDNIRIEFEKSK